MTKFGRNCQKWSIWAIFWKLAPWGQTVLPDMSLLIRQKLLENVKIKNSNATIFDNFQTLWNSLQNYLSSFILEIHFIMATCVTQGNISWFSHVIFLMEFNHWWCFLFFLVNYNQNLDNLHKIQNNDDDHHHWTFPGFSNYQNRQKRICWMCWGAWGALKGRHPAFHSVWKSPKCLIWFCFNFGIFHQFLFY